MVLNNKIFVPTYSDYMVLSSEIEAKYVNTSGQGLDYSQLHFLYREALGKLLLYNKHVVYVMRGQLPSRFSPPPTALSQFD